MIAETPFSKERIILEGPTFSGKSYAIVGLSRFLAVYRPQAKLYVIDTQGRFEAQARRFGAVLGIMEMRVCTNIQSVITWYDEIAKRVRPGDWVVADCVSETWDWAQDMVTQAIMGMPRADWIEGRATELSKERKDSTKKPPPPSAPPGTKADLFWQYAKNLAVTQLVLPLFAEQPANVLVTANPKRSSAPEYEARRLDVKRVSWDPAFPLPDGEPMLASRADTIIYLTYEREGMEMVHKAQVLKDYLYPDAISYGSWRVENLYLGLLRSRGVEPGT